MSRVVWGMTYPGPDIIEEAVTWGYTGGIKPLQVRIKRD